MYTPERSGRDAMGGRSSRRRHKRSAGRRTWAAVGLAAVSTLVPGVGHIWAGRRRIGIPILVLFLLFVGVGVFVVTKADRTQLLAYAVDTNVLAGVIIGALLLAVGWSAVIVSAYHIRRPGGSGPLHGVLAALVIGILSLAVSTPPIYAARQAYTGRDVLNTVFSNDDEKPRKTKEGKNPWEGRPRINVLLLGGDGGKDRVGVRTDTMVVASIDTRTGDTVLFSLPRNMLNAPVPEQMQDDFPTGHFTDMLNAVYVWGAHHPKEFPKASDPGAQATQGVIEEILGLEIDYYALVNLNAFTEIINAIGGITVYVEKDLPIGPKGAPTGWVRKGKRHLAGEKALWYARSRAADSDYERIKRQRCVLGAIAKQADPPTVLKGFQKIAAATKKNVRTDIPNDDLPALLKLGEKAKSAEITSLPFIPPLVNTGAPDYPRIRAQVQKTIEKAESKESSQPSASASQPTGPTEQPEERKTPSGDDNGNKPDSVDEVCGFD